MCLIVLFKKQYSKNNDVMISFLKSKGYDVLNLIEIRKPYEKEDNKEIIQIKNNKFRY